MIYKWWDPADDIVNELEEAMRATPAQRTAAKEAEIRRRDAEMKRRERAAAQACEEAAKRRLGGYRAVRVGGSPTRDLDKVPWDRARRAPPG